MRYDNSTTSVAVATTDAGTARYELHSRSKSTDARTVGANRYTFTKYFIYDRLEREVVGESQWINNSEL